MNSKKDFIVFYKNILNNFDIFFKQVNEREIKWEFKKYLNEKYSDACSYEEEKNNEEQEKAIFSDSLVELFSIIDKNKEYVEFCKKKFEIEMQTIISVLDSGGKIFISKHKYKISEKVINHKLKGKYQYLQFDELPLLFYSQKTMDGAKSVLKNVYEYKEINNYSDFSDQDCFLLTSNINNISEYTMEIDNMLLPEFEEYFDSYFEMAQKYKKNIVTVKDFKKFEKNKACVLDEIYQNLQDNVFNLLKIFTYSLDSVNLANHEIITSYKFKYLNRLRKMSNGNKQSPIGDGDEMQSFFKVQVFEKDSIAINNCIEQNNFNELFEEYNYFNLKSPMNVYESFSQNSSYFNKYWQDKDLTQTLTLVNKILLKKDVELDEKQIFIRDNLGYMKEEHFAYAKNSDNEKLEKQIKVFQEILIDICGDYSSEDQMKSGLIDESLDLLEQKKLYKMFQYAFIKSKAKKENKGLFEYVTTKQTVFSKIFMMSSIKIVFEDVFKDDNDSYLKIKNLMNRSVKSLYKEGIDIIVQEDRSNFSNSYIVINVNTDKIKEVDEQIMNKFYEDILLDLLMGRIGQDITQRYISESLIEEEGKYIREKILKHKMRIIDAEDKNKLLDRVSLARSKI